MNEQKSAEDDLQEDWMTPTLPKLPAARTEANAQRSASETMAERFSALWRVARPHAPFAVVSLLAIMLLTINVTTPWQSYHEDNGLLFENAAINHIRFGLAFTHGQDYFDTSVKPTISTPGAHFSDGTYHPMGVSSAQQFQYLLTGPVHPFLYGDHPPMLGLTIAASLLTFGYHFWAVRLVPIVATLIALILFYLLTLLLFDDRRVATFAAALFATFPITTYYGRSVTQEAETLCCVMGMALGYLLWRRTGRNRWLIAVAACVLLGGMYDWPMFYFCWLLFFLDTLRARRVNWRVALATAGAGTAIFALAIIQIAWASGWSLAHLEHQFFYRSTPIGLRGWVHSLGGFNLLDYGIWATPAALIALYFVWRVFRREGLSLRVQYVLLFGLGGLTHIVVFRQASFFHDYWQFYLIPFYALTLGWGGSELAKVLAKPTARWLAHLRIAHLRIAPQTTIMVSFGVLALVVAWPFTYHFYSFGVWPWSPPPHLPVSLF